MRKLALIPALALLAAACAPGRTVKSVQARDLKARAAAPAGPKRRIGVAEFENKTVYGQNRLGGAASDVLVTELMKSGNFIVVEREKVARVLEEQKFQAQGFTDQQTAVKLGQLLGMEALVVGSVSQFGVKKEGSDYLVTQSKSQVAEAVVDIRLIDAQSGQVILADSGKGRAKMTKSSFMGMGSTGGYDETLEGDALRAAIVQFVANISAQLASKPWTCAVAAAAGGQVYLNAGQASGVKTGAKLDCYRPGDEITDPSSGLVIGRMETPLGRVEVTGPCGDAGDCSKAAPERAGGPALRAGDLCRLAK